MDAKEREWKTGLSFWLLIRLPIPPISVHWRPFSIALELENFFPQSRKAAKEDKGFGFSSVTLGLLAAWR